MPYIATRRLPAAMRLVSSASLMVILAAGCQGARTPVPVAAAPQTVNVGYGTENRRSVTGAIASATAEELNEWKVGRVEEMLEGRFAGLDVARQGNGDFVMRIRGARGEPLVVVNGIPSPMGLSNPLRDLAPGSIASVSVLKDAGSTAAYGARGANGVILITTRNER